MLSVLKYVECPEMKYYKGVLKKHCLETDDMYVFGIGPAAGFNDRIGLCIC